MVKSRESQPPSRPGHGLLRILATIAVMTALGAALGVLAAHIGH